MANTPLSTRTYDVGDTVRAKVTFKVGGVLTDPATVAFSFKDPAGSVTNQQAGNIVKDSTGNYHSDFTVNAAGSWYYRWVGTGPASGAAEVRVQVRTSEF